MKHINIKKMSYYEFKYQYHHMLNEISNLQSEVRKLKNEHWDRGDDLASAYQQIKQAKKYLSVMEGELPKGAYDPLKKGYLGNTREDVLVPHSAEVKKGHTDWKHINFLRNLAKELQSKHVIVSSFHTSHDENDNDNYEITVSPVRKEYAFINAVDKIDDYKGISRLNWKKDAWVTFDVHNHLVIKYKGDDREFPYQPTKKDLNAKDWVVEYVRPFNPNTKPVGSDPRDDSTDTNKFGFDGDEAFIDSYDD